MLTSLRRTMRHQLSTFQRRIVTWENRFPSWIDSLEKIYYAMLLSSKSIKLCHHHHPPHIKIYWSGLLCAVNHQYYWINGWSTWINKFYWLANRRKLKGNANQTAPTKQDGLFYFKIYSTSSNTATNVINPIIFLW